MTKLGETRPILFKGSLPAANKGQFRRLELLHERPGGERESERATELPEFDNFLMLHARFNPSKKLNALQDSRDGVVTALCRHRCREV